MIEEALLKSNYIGKDGFSWWIGQIAKKESWVKGSSYNVPGDWPARCKVRIIGYHIFDGNILSDDDLPWAHVMLDPSLGSAQGGIGGTTHLKGGETCFGFFLDGDDGQQPVIVGLLHRSENVKNLMTDALIEKEKSSQFKPFSGNPNPPSTQRNARHDKEINQQESTEQRNQNSETSPVPGDIVNIAFSGIDLGFNIAGVGTNIQWGDKLAGVIDGTGAASIQAINRAFSMQPAFVKPNGCQNNIIGQITQGLQDFIAFTNGLDRYIDVYIDPVLNEIVDIGNSIKNCARQIGGIVKLIINNLRDTIFKCIGWAFRKLVGLVIPQPQQKIVFEVMKKYLDTIFCILEKLPDDIIGFLEDLLGDLAANTINAPICALEQWTAAVLSKVMNSIEEALETIMSGIGWLTGGLSTVSGILNQASSLASQIYSFLSCTGLACETPSTWALNIGPSEKEPDNWQKMVDKVNVFNTVSEGLGSIEDALQVTPLYAGINGRFLNIFNTCNQKVINPTEQDDIIPLPIGSKYSNCIPPIVRIIGDGIGAKAIPIVGNDNSIFSIKIISGGVGYTKPPTVTIVDNTGHGSRARANAIVSAGGTISSIYLINPGSGYCRGDYSGIGTNVSGIVTDVSGISSQISGIVTSVVVISPGYGYTSGDTISDGKNNYIPVVSPGSGSIIKVEIPQNLIGGFTSAPTLTINTRTGVAAKIVPNMEYTPTFNVIEQQTAVSGIITSVVDCV